MWTSSSATDGGSNVAVVEARRILIVARMSPRLNSRTRFLAEALAKTCEVTVVSEAPSGMRGSRTIDGVRLREVRLAFRDRRFWWITGAIRVVQLNVIGMMEALRKRYDAVVCADAPYCFSGMAGKYLRRRVFVLDAQEVMWALGYGRVWSGLMWLVEKVALGSCDLVVVPSVKRAELALGAQGLRRPYIVVENLPWLPDALPSPGAFRPRLKALGVPDGAVTVMFQGSVGERRGLEQLVVAATRGYLHLIVQGPGSNRLDLKSAQNVTVLDPCPNEETVEWLSAADFSFVYYENDCLNSAYACSTKLYSSIIAGTPVLCNRLPAFEEFASRFGGLLFVDSLDPGYIHQRLREVLDAPGAYERLRTQAAVGREQLLRVPRAEVVRAAFIKLLDTRGHRAGTESCASL